VQLTESGLLAAAIHMFVETVFWFHPLVWWIGKRMVEERERACDEEVLQLGGEPRVYAERDSQRLQALRGIGAAVRVWCGGA
jgi:beta-lactamase regulating signal transducer with metallopeptidase domain